MYLAECNNCKENVGGDNKLEPVSNVDEQMEQVSGGYLNLKIGLN